jgi:hypothetical protein
VPICYTADRSLAIKLISVTYLLCVTSRRLCAIREGGGIGSVSLVSIPEREEDPETPTPTHLSPPVSLLKEEQ